MKSFSKLTFPLKYPTLPVFVFMHPFRIAVQQLYSAIQTGAGSGMQTLDQCLKDLLAEGMVTQEEAKLKANMPENL